MSLHTFEVAYIECALWSSTDGDTDTPLDRDYCINDLAPEAREATRRDCEAFYAAHGHRFDDDARAGHDFWLNRNGHGSGFWDRPEVYGEHTATLDKAASEAGEVYLYVGDDGKLYI